MKTDELVSLLAREAQPVPRHAAARRLAIALLAGLPLSIAWMVFEYGVRRDLVQTMFWPMFWVKLAFPICVAIAGFVIVQRLARPGVQVRGAWLGLALPVLALWVMGFVAWFLAPADERAALVWGQTWRTCAFNIAVISVPIFVAALVALKSLAPTQPALAGAAAGAMSAGAGAAVYALHCPELAAPFLAVWYVGGMVLPILAGAAVGHRLLRW
ncbi:DUF1109 domain-containing protein [Variovorax paradoxus]|nr:DUF1109 domain-containing protein [Variovorax paradoxus]